MPHYSWDCYRTAIFEQEIVKLESEIVDHKADMKAVTLQYLYDRVDEIKKIYKD
jgi:hypothetical protein